MKVVWIHRGGEGMASYRYRAKIPSENVSFESSINQGQAEVIVFSKPVSEDVNIAKESKKHGCKIVADIGDTKHLNHPQIGPIYREILECADLVITPTEYSRDLLKSNKPVEVIPDPYEEEECEPHTEGNKTLWFGNNVNLGEIEPHKDLVTKLDFELKILTGPQGDWTPENQTKALRETNIVLLPTRKGAEYKSPNRLINAIRAGAFAVCERHPAYEEFRHLVWTNDIRTGLQWTKTVELNELVKEAQDYIRDKYSPQTIGQLWQSALESI